MKILIYGTGSNQILEFILDIRCIIVIEVPVPSQENVHACTKPGKRSCICMLEVSILPLSFIHFDI
jgi:hypothetical protein